MEDAAQPELFYPLYLDVPMMISFLAAIENGVSYEANVQKRVGSKKSVTGEASGGVGLPSLLGLLPFDLRGRLTGDTGTESSEEMQLVKRHTEASLFNKLRGALHSHGSIRNLEKVWNSEDGVESGDLIEITGTVTRNPIEELVTVFERIKPLIVANSSGPIPAPKSRNRQAAAQASHSGSRQTNSTTPNQPDPFVIFEWVKEDIRAADMADIVLRPADASLPAGILTMSHDFGTGRTVDSLAGAEVTVLGKVTAAVQEGANISLLRRSILGYMSEEEQEGLFDRFEDNPFMGHLIDRLMVKLPVVQILPLAVFV